MANRLFLVVIIEAKSSTELMWGQRQEPVTEPDQYPVFWSPLLLKHRDLKYFFRVD
jgi:hypothetical protein